MSSLEERSEQHIVQPQAAAPPEHDWRASYSLSSPGMRMALSPQAHGAPHDHALGPHNFTVVPDTVPHNKPEILVPLKATAKLSAPADEQLHDHSRVVDPCNRTMTNPTFLPGNDPKPMNRVKDRDPKLYSEIQGKVKDPRYIGQNGDITVSTHDKRGHINGCVFVQNSPYWLDASAAKSYLDVNAALKPKHKEIEVDHLNGAGRTLGQEEGIAWRNTGLHAKPGHSNHGFGRAIDLQDHAGNSTQPSDDKDIREALHANGFRQGDSHGPLKSDLHHWSYTGPGRATEAGGGHAGHATHEGRTERGHHHQAGHHSPAPHHHHRS